MSLTNLTPIGVESQPENSARTGGNTTSSASTQSSESSPKNDKDLNFTLYGAPAPIRRTRTVIQRKKGHTTITLRPVDLNPSMAGGAAKLLAEDTTLDLGFAHDDNFDIIHPYNQITESTSSTTRSSIYFLNDGTNSQNTSCETFTNESKSEPVPEVILNDLSAKKDMLKKNSSRSSTTTYDSSSKSDCGSFESQIDDEDVDDDTNGEWNTFWQSYSKPGGFKLNDFLKLEDLNKVRQSSESDTSHPSLDLAMTKSRPRKKSKCTPAVQRVIMSTSDAIEAAKCARRLSEILSLAIRRSSLPCTTRNEPEPEPDSNTEETKSIPKPPPLPNSARSSLVRSKSEPKINETEINATNLKNQRLLLKPLKFDNCVEVEIRTKDHVNVAEILQKVINQRRDIIMPPEDRLSTCQSNRSDWSCID